MTTRVKPATHRTRRSQTQPRCSALILGLALALGPACGEDGQVSSDGIMAGDRTVTGDGATRSPDAGISVDRGPSTGDLGVQPPPEGGVQPDTKPPKPPGGELLLFDEKNLQFVTTDKGFHPLIEPGDPLPASNWLSPTDFYSGEFQFRYVIQSPADQAAGKLQICLWTMGNEDGDGKNYFPENCSPQVPHTGVGTYTIAKSPADFWKKDGKPVDFTHPERFLIRVVLRGTSGCVVTPIASVTGACWDQWPKFQNMKYRVTIVMVPKGGTFSGWQSYP